MASKKDIVITGMGVVCPIGIGQEAVWTSLCEGRSGVRRLDLFSDPDIIPFGGEVADFDPKKLIKQRKTLKVMSRDIQFAFVSAEMACLEAGHPDRPIDPERFGVVFGDDIIPCELSELVPAYRKCMTDGKFDPTRWGQSAMTEIFPLWMLKYLPNMPACHIGIVQDARGPNNTLTLGDVASLSAAAEAVRVLQRGAADAMIVGGSGSKIQPTMLFRGGAFELSHRGDDPPTASRPFDATRDGMVNSEGAAAFMFETLDHAQSRGTNILAKVLGYSAAFEPTSNGRALQGTSIRQAINGALAVAGITPADVGCVVAHGISTIQDDHREAAAIHYVLGDVPVTAPKSYYGHSGAGCGAIDMAVALLALKNRTIPPTLNYHKPDPLCPIRVVHDKSQPLEKPIIMVISHSQHGQAVAMLLGARD